jgi:NADH dehydrogenase
MILVTGATGFVGGHVVRTLRAQDRPVRALVRNPGRAVELQTLGVELAEGDMGDADSLRRAVDGCDTVLHLVAIRQGKAEDFERTMSAGTRDLLAAAAGAGLRRFVHMSALGTGEDTKELVPYFGAKWEMEQAVRESGLTYVIFRPSFIFARDGGILPTFRRLARLAPFTPVTGSGEQRIQPIWADDVASYFARAVDLESADNGVWELGGPDIVTWNEFWERLRASLGIRRRPLVHMPMALMRANALVTERLPGNIPLTRDLLKMLEGPDNVVADDRAPAVFGMTLLPLDEQLSRAA